MQENAFCSRAKRERPEVSPRPPIAFLDIADQREPKAIFRFRPNSRGGLVSTLE